MSVSSVESCLLDQQKQHPKLSLPPDFNELSAAKISAPNDSGLPGGHALDDKRNPTEADDYPASSTTECETTSYNTPPENPTETTTSDFKVVLWGKTDERQKTKPDVEVWLVRCMTEIKRVKAWVKDGSPKVDELCDLYSWEIKSILHQRRWGGFINGRPLIRTAITISTCELPEFLYRVIHDGNAEAEGPEWDATQRIWHASHLIRKFKLDRHKLCEAEYLIENSIPEQALVEVIHLPELQRLTGHVFKLGVTEEVL